MTTKKPMVGPISGTEVTSIVDVFWQLCCGASTGVVLVTDATLVAQAEPYDVVITHAGGHPA